MRLLFSSTPALGHLLPMLPLAAAARSAGHEVALLSHPSMASFAAGMPLLPAGPSIPETFEDVTRRTAVDAMQDMAAGPVEFFVESRVSLGAEAALAAAGDFAPDLIVADMIDYLGPLAAAALGVPWAAHGAALPLDSQLAAALDQAAAARFAQYGVTPTAPVAYVDPWPDSLLGDGYALPAERMTIRPEPHSDESSTWSRPRFDGREDRPLILVTLGTVVDDPSTLGAILDSLAPLDVNVIVAPHSATDLADRKVDSTRVHLAGFVPMKQLLEGVDVVVSSAGAGSVLSALSAARPMVLFPMGLDKPLNAARAAEARAAVVIDAADQVGDAVAQVLADPAVADGAATVAEEIAGMNSPDDVLGLLLKRVG
ncbi:glycosyltransferase [Actinoallomurus soli]|uniref:glycosyltransferase n=1 Tax=Actinoallomurus soli TaxID=2952535 RepID=UPI002092173F|nr:glycosyltransferase [Actinoallomurus soli]MCO5971812.1 glycosyltransferase [Actinoallomurus soli]